jgi:hypothetical protein
MAKRIAPSAWQLCGVRFGFAITKVIWPLKVAVSTLRCHVLPLSSQIDDNE